MTYQSLTPAQRDQAAFLFADDIFGTDPNAYEYELTGAMVTGRIQRTAINSKLLAHARKPHAVAVNVAVRDIPGQFVTVEMDRTATTTIQEIARNVVARLVQVKSVEA
jgi:hypothetical protein